MCGIAGLIEARSPERDARVEAMRARLTHRGPDDAGFYADDAIALGFARLSIVDLAGGAQPMANEDGSLRLVFNGEIYNHREIRARLSGHAFRTVCDAEAVLHAYEEYGEACLDHLRGMFAFAIWNARERTLFAARDRLGKKPFVYAAADGRFAFASELQALREAGVPWRLEPGQLEPYLAYGYVPSPSTMVAGVRKLAPGHWLRWRAGALEVRRYWRPSVEIREGTAEEHAGGVVEALTRAVEVRLQADVPVGAFLSGGIDSSIVVGLMSRLLREPVRTFSVGFEDDALDERPYARAVARKWGTDHHETVVRADAVTALPKLVDHFGEPFGDPSAVPTYYVARETRRHVKVALSGDGGDECFGGYRRYAALGELERLRRWGWIVPLLAPLYRPRRYGARIRRLLRHVRRPAAWLYRDLVSVFNDDDRARLLRRRADAASAVEGSFAAQTDAVTAAGLTDLVTYLPDDLLAKVDIASMANSLEVRCPFLDPEVVAKAFSISATLKIRGRETKFLLRHAFRDLLPPEIRGREKRGFSIPVDAWLRGPLRSMMRDLLLDATARQRPWVDARELEALVARHEAGDGRGAQLWALLVLELWLRRASVGL